jgi:hypothetical protein
MLLHFDAGGECRAAPLCVKNSSWRSHESPQEPAINIPEAVSIAAIRRGEKSLNFVPGLLQLIVGISPRFSAQRKVTAAFLSAR